MSRTEIKNIRWIFFDLGSTLLDESECYRQRILEMIDDSGVNYDDFYAVMMSFYRQGEKGDKLAAERYGFKLPAWRSEFEVLFPDAKSVLEKLSRNYRLGIIANQNPGTVQRLTAFGIADYFDVVAASAEEGVAKPDPKIFLRALSRAGCTPEEAAMIGDRPDNDILPANRLGMTTVRILSGVWKSSPTSCEDETPDYTIGGLNELCGIFL